MRPALLALPFIVALATCGAPRPDPDAARDAPADADAAPVAPTPPAPPVLTPCPPGWRTVTSPTGVETCDAWPETGYRTDCAWDEAHWPGTPGCTRVGTACPADGWPEGLPAGRPVVYVDDDAAPGGDGSSRARAYRTIAEATAAARPGSVIAVAVGRYDERVQVGAGATLWGACVSGTRIVRSAPALTFFDSALRFVGNGAGARNVGIQAPESPGIAAVANAGVTIDAVVVAESRWFGLFVIGGEIAATDFVIRGTRERSSDRTLGRGIDVQARARLTLRRAIIEDNLEYGVIESGAGTHVDASDLVVRGTRERTSDGLRGRGIDIEPGAQLVLSRALIEDNREFGIGAIGVGTALSATDLVVRGTHELASDGTSGRGIDVETGARITVARALVEGNPENGIFAMGAGTSIEATDVVVRGTMPRVSDGALGVGVWAQVSARVVLDRVLVERSHFVGIGSVGRASVEASNVVVNGVEPSRCAPRSCTGDSGAFGLAADFGGTVRATRFAVVGATVCGVLVGGHGVDILRTGMDLETGVIARSVVGACVQVDGYDLTRLRRDVQYRDVAVPTQATSYTLPEAL